MGAQGTASLNFGAFPGAPLASVDVTGQGSILSGSLVEAWVLPASTADHSVGEHVIDPPSVMAGTVIAGTGFTIYGAAYPEAGLPRHYGIFNIAWCWN